MSSKELCPEMTSKGNTELQTNGTKPTKFGIICPINTNTFPGKLWKLVNDERCESILWNVNGTCIVIYPQSFAENVLQGNENSIFKTQNYSSFVRQLNLYGFRKITITSKKFCGLNTDSMQRESQPNYFRHPQFLRARPDMLCNIKRASVRRKWAGESGYLELDTSFMSFQNQEQDSFSHVSHMPWNYGSSGENYAFQPLCQPTEHPYNFEEDEAFSPTQLPVVNKPSFHLHHTQHPFRRSDNGRPCGLDLKWMANSQRGTLTASSMTRANAGSCPSTLMHQGPVGMRLRRFVMIPDDSSAIAHSGLPHQNPLYNDPRPAPSHFSFPPVQSNYYNQPSPFTNELNGFVRETNLMPPLLPQGPADAYDRLPCKSNIIGKPLIPLSTRCNMLNQNNLSPTPTDTNFEVKASSGTSLKRSVSVDDPVNPVKTPRKATEVTENLSLRQEGGGDFCIRYDTEPNFNFGNKNELVQVKA